jgi:hypothetical protein
MMDSQIEILFSLWVKDEYRASAKDKSTFIEAKGAGHSPFVNPYQQLNALRKSTITHQPKNPTTKRHFQTTKN